MFVVIEALAVIQAALEAQGLKVFIDRDATNPVREEDMPCVCLTWAGAPISTDNFCQDSYRWNGEVLADCWAKIEIGVPVLNGCGDQAAKVASAFGDDYTFGGKFIEASLTAITGLELINEQCGSIGLTAPVVFQTTKSDWTRLLSN